MEAHALYKKHTAASVSYKMISADKFKQQELALLQKASLVAVAELTTQQKLSNVEISKAEVAWTAA